MHEPEENEIPPKPEPLSPRYSCMPEILKTARIWVVWDYVLIDGRWAKVPFCAQFSNPSVEYASQHIGRVGWWPRARSNSTATWATWEDVMSVAHLFAGVGIMVCKGVCGVDLDKCLDPDGTLDDWAAKVVDDLDAYTELSPSGRGLRILTLASKPGDRCRSGQIEMYVNTRFLTLTGHVIRQRAWRGGTVRSPPCTTASSPRRPRSTRSRRSPRRSGGRHPGGRWATQQHARGLRGPLPRLWAGDMSDYDLDHSRRDLCAVQHALRRSAASTTTKWTRRSAARA
jgi:primase-polymerase (primpol)-like protein